MLQQNSASLERVAGRACWVAQCAMHCLLGPSQLVAAISSSKKNLNHLYCSAAPCSFLTTTQGQGSA